jgi:hypothetical protein
MKTARLFVTTLVLFITMSLLMAMAFTDHVVQGQKETRNVGNFTELGLAIDADVVLTQGKECSVAIDAEPDMLKLIITEVKDGKLKIKYDKWTVPRHEKITVYVTMVDVKGLALSGSGNIVADGTLNTTDLDLAISGSGNIKLGELTASNLEAAISGSGDMVLAGPSPASTMEISISGSGGVNAESLEVKSMEVAISGSGSCVVKVTGSLEASIAGSGNVTCTGNPQVDAHVSGSGRVITH